MYFLIADETHQQKNDHDVFFTYGAIIVPTSQVASLTSDVEEIRRKYKFKHSDSLKFSPADKPKDLSLPDFLQCKSEVFAAASQREVRFMGYALLHAIGKDKTNEEIICWGADAILTKFQQFLEENGGERGVCFFDTLPIRKSNRFLREAFQKRLIHEKAGHRLENIDMIATVTDGCSHLTSVCDICAGSFGFAVNNPDKDIAGPSLMKALWPLLWGEMADGRERKLVKERGLLLRPQKRTKKEFADKYEALKSRLLSWASD